MSEAATVIGWSEGTSSLKSARFAKGHTLEKYGVPTENAQNDEPPYGGMAFMKSISYTSDNLSLGLRTDREWSAARASCILVKGTVDVEAAKKVLQTEAGGEPHGGKTLYPVLCRISEGGQGQTLTKALATIWINQLHDSVCGAYHEYVVSIDVTTKEEGVVAFVVPNKNAAAYACWYNNFGNDVCEAQFLQSLYINSPISIAWGREMQAFPKHPIPVDSEIDVVANDKKTSKFGWSNDEMLMNVVTISTFGIKGFLQEAWGLIKSVGIFRVLNFLAKPTFQSNIFMPQATAKQYKRPSMYTATLWKGLLPTAVQLWPWNSDTDTIELGTISKPTGAEEGNGMPWLKQAGFDPLGVCYIERLSAMVQVRED